MEKLKNIVQNGSSQRKFISGYNFRSNKGTIQDVKRCSKCGDPIEKIVNIPAFNMTFTAPIPCRCEVEKINKNKKEEESHEKQRRLKTLMKNSLTNKKFKQNTFENWNFSLVAKQKYIFAKDYANNFKFKKRDNIGFLLHGDPGIGKTFMCDCIANYLLKKGIPVIDTKIGVLLNRIRLTYDTFGKETPEYVINGLFNADLLILDDLGTENDTNWNKKMLYNIIEFRINNSLPMIVTTNYSSDFLANNYPLRTLSRLYNACPPIEITGVDIRELESDRKALKLKELLSD